MKIDFTARIHLLGRLRRFVTTFHDERVGLATLDVDLGNQLIVHVPGDTPRWIAGDWRVTSATTRWADPCRNHLLPEDGTGWPWFRTIFRLIVIDRIGTRVIVLGRKVYLHIVHRHLGTGV